MNFKTEIEKLIEKRKDNYISSFDNMLSDYNREGETTKDYNGRQILELLQNADDQSSDDVLIKLDTTKKELSISNNGNEPFSIDGIKSIMISNISPKNNNKYIGNKGLGFRSIINWSDVISIYSNGLKIDFSQEIATSIYNEMFDEQQRKQYCEKQKKRYSKTFLPILAIPQITENANTEKYTTTIKIKYKDEVESNIIEQINNLTPEILLFLNNINTLTIHNDNEEYKYNKNELSKKWCIYDKHGDIPKEYLQDSEENKQYAIKIALNDNVENDIKKLFSYFPTKIEITMPFIVHATFELLP